MKTSKHTPKAKSKPASITKHARVLGNLGGRPKNDEKEARKEIRPTDSKRRQAKTS